MYMHIHVYHLTFSSVLTIVSGSNLASAAERGHTQVRSCTYTVLYLVYTNLCMYMHIHVYHRTVSSVLAIVSGSNLASAAERGHTQVRSYTDMVIFLCLYTFVYLYAYTCIS